MRAKTLLLVAAGLMIAGRARAVTITRGPIIENPDALTTTMTIAWWTDTTGDSTVEYGPTPQMFTNPREKLTEDYITGRFG